jgi:hypothetical protein
MLLACTQVSKIDVSVSDAEIVDYMKKNERDSKQMKLVVEYVLIASKEDEAEVKTKSINC